MSIAKYTVDGTTFWKVDAWLATPTDQLVRFRQRKIPTREMAEALLAKKRAAAFEGRHFERLKEVSFTVSEAWSLYKDGRAEKYDSWNTDTGRASHLVRHLGQKQAKGLTKHDIELYRTARRSETTRRKARPSAATLDREVELLRRVFNYAVDAKRLPQNPIASVELLHESNVRRTIVAEDVFDQIVSKADAWFRPILLVAYDTGMREREVLDLEWVQVNLVEGSISLAPEDTKTEEARTVYLTKRVLKALKVLPSRGTSPYVFVNPETGNPWADIRKVFGRALEAAKLSGVWFHDLRRSFVTLTRRKGIAESVVMRMSGHRTRAVFDRYNVVADEDVKAAVARLDAGRRSPRGQKLDNGKMGSPRNAETPPDSDGVSGTSK